MQVSYEEALKIYEKLSPELKAPALHPYYVVVDAKRDSTLIPTFFAYQKDNHIFYHGFHLSKVNGTEFWDIQSPYGYGGPILSSNDPDFVSYVEKKYFDWCKKQNILVEFIRFHPLLNNGWNLSMEKIDDRLTVWIDLGIGDPFKSYKPSVRNKIKKAIKHLTFKWVDSSLFLNVFPTLYYRTMKKLQANSFYFFAEDYIKQLCTWKQVRLAACFLDNQVVAASIFIYDSNIMEYHLSAANEIGKEYAASNLMIHEAVLLGKRLGCSSLHLGGGTDSMSNNSLFVFKEGFSPEKSIFRIGKYLHNPDKYNQMKNDWYIQHGKVSNKILFYRY